MQCGAFFALRQLCIRLNRKRICFDAHEWKSCSFSPTFSTEYSGIFIMEIKQLWTILIHIKLYANLFYEEQFEYLGIDVFRYPCEKSDYLNPMVRRVCVNMNKYIQVNCYSDIMDKLCFNNQASFLDFHDIFWEQFLDIYRDLKQRNSALRTGINNQQTQQSTNDFLLSLLMDQDSYHLAYTGHITGTMGTAVQKATIRCEQIIIQFTKKQLSGELLHERFDHDTLKKITSTCKISKKIDKHSRKFVVNLLSYNQT